MMQCDNPTANTKECFSCEQILSSDQFGVDRAKKDGLSYNCLPCLRSLRATYRRRDGTPPRTFIEVKDGLKLCTNMKCRKWLPVTEFFKDRTHKTGLSPSCKTCDKISKADLRARKGAADLGDKKTCADCSLEKSLKDFRRDLDCLGGLKTECFACERRYLRLIFSNLLSAKRGKCREKGIPFSMTIQDMKGIWTGRCECCSLPLIFSLGDQKETSPTIDKIVVEEGYVPGNIQWLCARCNRIQDNGEGLLHLKLVYLRAKHLGVKPEFMTFLESEDCPLFDPDYAGEPESMLYPVPVDPYLPDGTLRPEAMGELDAELSRRLGSL